ncbi:MAG: hypothetical protein PWP08_172 [Methanofollis sp.]|nr:hypothetical protein [Methanofollis sp.]
MGGGDLPVLLFFLALLAVSLYALLLIPFEIRFSGSYGAGAGRGFCAFRWAAASFRLMWEGTLRAEAALGRTVLFSMPVGGGDEGTTGEKTAKAAGPGAGKLLAAVRAVLPGFIDLLEYFVARCRIGCGQIWFRAGLDDPVDTGIAYGIVQAVNGVLYATQCRIAMDPLFDGGEFAGEGEGVVWIDRPLTVLIMAAIFLLSPPVRTTVWPMIRGEE